MARSLLARELTPAAEGRVQFETARASDDPGIRRLLRENPMPGPISFSLEREPNYFADATSPCELCQTIVARDCGRVVGVGRCTIRERFVNGRVARVGYLAGLRLDSSYWGRFDVLRRGYELFRELQADAPADFYFTSIATENTRARRFLEHGLRGMPSYEFLTEFVTVLISTNIRRGMPDSSNRRNKRTNPLPDKSGVPGTVSTDPPGPAPEMIAFLNQYNLSRQFAPKWSPDQLTEPASLNLKSSDFAALRLDDQIIACGALWDQRPFKQARIRGYSKSVACSRPLFNLFARCAGRPRLPATGEILSTAYASHLAVDSRCESRLPDLIRGLCIQARRRGIHLLTLGFAAGDPLLALLRGAFRCREYKSRLYAVSWPGIGGRKHELDSRLAAPEVALL